MYQRTQAFRLLYLRCYLTGSSLLKDQAPLQCDTATSVPEEVAAEVTSRGIRGHLGGPETHDTREPDVQETHE